MTQSDKPVVRELTSEEVDALLSRNWIARLAFSWHDHVDLEPIHYVYDPPWIFGRTGVGAKLLALAHNQWCALEVDEVEDLFDWQSVVVKGPFSALNSSLGESDLHDRAVAALRKLVPATLTNDDPVPERSVLFGIHVTETLGRRMTPSGASGAETPEAPAPADEGATTAATGD